jgi:hypothetical protein
VPSLLPAFAFVFFLPPAIVIAPSDTARMLVDVPSLWEPRSDGMVKRSCPS